MKAFKFWFNFLNSKGSKLSFSYFFFSGLSLAIYLYFPAFDSWYLREDSRFFSVAPFSLYDLYDAFATPFNSMGQYRPITKVLWSLPVWLGLPIPFTYHMLSFGLLIVAGLALARIQYKLYPSVAVSGLTFCIYILLPIHQKIMYWISAWHNIAAATFFFLCLALRFDLPKDGGSRFFLRGLSLFFLFLGFASREIVFVVVPIIVAVDYFYGEKKIKMSLDVISLSLFFFVYLFIIASPFQVAGVRLAGESVFSIKWIFETVDQVITNTFWSEGDAFHTVSSLTRRAIAYAVFTGGFIGLCFRPNFLLPMAMVVLGVSPFIVIGNLNLEYLVIFGGGLVLMGASLIALVCEKLSREWRVLFQFALALLPFIYVHQLEPTRSLYAGYYRVESHLVRDFVQKFSNFSDRSESDRFIEIVDFGEYVKSPASMSHHFLILGLDHLVPKHFSLFSNEALEINDGTALKDLQDAHAFWRHITPLVFPPIKVRYRDNKIEAIHD